MSHNPFLPPKSEVALPSQPSAPWHMVFASGILMFLGAWAFIASVVALVMTATSDFPLWFYYLALLPSLLTLGAAYCLWRKSKWVIALLLLALLLALSVHLFFASTPSVSIATTLAGRVLERLPLQLLVQLGIFSAALLYSAFLIKWGHLN